MIGTICLQGGAEFTAGCREMDEAWLARVATGPVSIAPLACAEGTEYRIAGHNGADYLRGLGVADITVAPEPNIALDVAVRAILDAAIVIIPGGSPSRIRRRAVGTAIGGALRAHLAGGGTIVGSSAGAMVLADHMLLPGEGMQVDTGLGAVPDVLVLPHYDEPRPAVVENVSTQLGDDVTVLAIPTCCGVLYADDAPVALGADESWWFTPGSEPKPVPRG